MKTIKKRCHRCQKIKFLSEFYKCKSKKGGFDTKCKKCDKELRWEKFEREPWYLHLSSSKSRCLNKKSNYYRKGIKNYLTNGDVKYLWFRDKAYLMKKPSIDRIDNDGNYILHNCRFIEHSENARRGNIGNKNYLFRTKVNKPSGKKGER